MSRPLIALAIASLFYIAACTNNKYADIVPTNNNNNSGCETTNMSYATDIAPIIQNNCNSCHSAGAAPGQGTVALDTYNDLKNNINETLERVNLQPSEGRFMPRSGSSIGSCDIDKIRAWKDQGFAQ